jgi:steroid delta-isomerase-like uncharacterized protein
VAGIWLDIHGQAKSNNLIKIKEGYMKNPLLVVSLVFLLCFAFGCQNKAEKAELEKFRAQAKLVEQNREFVKHYFEEMNKGNVEVINETCAPEYLFYSPSINPKPLSREETIEFLKTAFKAIPDLNYRIEKLFVVGDTAIIRNIATGTHQGELMGIPATGNRFEVSSILIWSLKDGKIVEEREEYDSLGLMTQLGMELKPIEAKKK